MNRGEQRETVRLLVGETTADGYKDSEIDSQLNRSTLRVAIETKCLESDWTLEIVAYNSGFPDPLDSRADGRYGLPEDLLAIEDFQLLDGSTRTFPRYLPLRQLIRLYGNTTGGPPSRWGVAFGATDQSGPTRGDIWLRPWPDKSYTGIIYGVQRPSKMDEDTDYSELPEFAHDAVCYHAAMIVSRKFKDRALITEMAALYQNEIRIVNEMVHQDDMTGPVYVRNVYRRRRPRL